MRRVVVLVFLAVFLATPALADPYFSASFGLANVRDADLRDGRDGTRGDMKLDNGYVFLAAIGGSFLGDVRGEIELGYRNNDIDRLRSGVQVVSRSGDVTAISLMANLFKDIPLGIGLTPFVGGGIGIANVEADLNAFGINGKKDDNVFAYQFAAGGAIELGPQVNLDLQYRYFATADPDFSHLEAEYRTHNVLLGLRFGF
ncbi:outer membrane protein [Geoalkalibacter halelectricus]|uniref:Outer membrane beta-barrel protein n=1 Tax=Geoalkalibacter halelectricus TaxID=2847045 RepID=A0ABY5ZUD5_9BACT|nr:outer membrane beta-barrel protein [Geoalkalibacter halelectricus]MDO3379138.1 outer membrane beta-barrel protein [Geoalkalibacter halelectricus]UWZ81562.1 outer membrane beta-barrel protein [Geoalkalibacter halelectricus]